QAVGTKEIHHNRLVAINLESGKIDWMQGGPAQAEARSLDDAVFLGPPLPLAGKLYALMEKESELRLVCLDPHQGEICWNQPLITYKKSVMHECGRRLWAAPLAYEDGILVCPSNSGAVVGVDLLTHSLVWAYSYVEAPAAPMNAPPNAARLVARTSRVLAPPRLTASWKNAGPIIAGGKVIISAPDAAALHCLNLRDGSLAWKIDRHPDDQYVAGVFADKVLIVGQSQCRAVSLTDGKQLWQTLSRLPAGQGVFADGHYYLPLRSGADGPCIVALDMADGKTVHRIDMPRHDGPGHTSERDVPGNLV